MDSLGSHESLVTSRQPKEASFAGKKQPGTGLPGWIPSGPLVNPYGAASGMQLDVVGIRRNS